MQQLFSHSKIPENPWQNKINLYLLLMLNISTYNTYIFSMSTVVLFNQFCFVVIVVHSIFICCDVLLVYIQCKVYIGKQTNMLSLNIYICDSNYLIYVRMRILVKLIVLIVFRLWFLIMHIICIYGCCMYCYTYRKIN